MKNKPISVIGVYGVILLGMIGPVECQADKPDKPDTPVPAPTPNGALVAEGLTFTIASNGTLTLGGGAINSSATVSVQPNTGAKTINNLWITDNRPTFSKWTLTASATGWTINGMPINNQIPLSMYSTVVTSNGTAIGLATPVDLMQYNATIANCTTKAGTVIVTPMVATGAQGENFASGVYAVNITYYLTPSQ